MSFYERIVVSGELCEEKVKKIEELGEKLEPKIFETEDERKAYFVLKEQAEEELKRYSIKGGFPLSKNVNIIYDNNDHQTSIEIGYLSTGVLPHQDTCYPFPINETNKKIAYAIEQVAMSK